MTVGDNGDQAGLGGRHAIGNAFGAQSLGPSIEDPDQVPSISAITGDEPTPKGRFNGGEIVAEFLIDYVQRTGIHKQKIKQRLAPKVSGFHDIR